MQLSKFGPDPVLLVNNRLEVGHVHTHDVRSGHLITQDDVLDVVVKFGRPDPLAIGTKKADIDQRQLDPYYIGKHYLKEEIVADFARSMNWSIVPRTATCVAENCSDPAGCMVQEFIPGKNLMELLPGQCDRDIRDGVLITKYGAQMALLDYLTNQKDRCYYNIHLGYDGILYAIDNELAFEPSYVKENHYAWELYESAAVRVWIRLEVPRLTQLMEELTDEIFKCPAYITNSIRQVADQIEFGIKHAEQLAEEYHRRFTFLQRFGFKKAVGLWYDYCRNRTPDEHRRRWSKGIR